MAKILRAGSARKSGEFGLVSQSEDDVHGKYTLVSIQRIVAASTMRRRQGQVQPVDFRPTRRSERIRTGQSGLCGKQNDRTVKERCESGVRSRFIAICEEDSI